MTDTKQDARPRDMTREIALRAATTIAKELLSARHIEPNEIEDAAKAIQRHARGRYIDGYSLAKALDDREGWECNFAMAEILDRFSSEVSGQLRDAEKEWFERVKPVPPFPIGTRVQTSHKEAGTITGIYEHGPAQYLVKIDGDPRAKAPTHSRSIVNFEDVQALTEERAHAS